ncbi:CPBP family intramembrane glutamic endopeptidase [Parapedobacter defluvii]|uniref:CPBP family intramembrane glutamic endopeptidase n=1 Tax=Parapedobacter defluvii TaxID=2045106 RepID=UPI00333E57C6
MFPSVRGNPYLHPQIEKSLMIEQRTIRGGASDQEGNHPMKSLILLLLLAFSGAIILGAISVFIGLLATGVPVGDLEGALSEGAADVDFLKIVQAGSSIGMFVLPALLLGITEKRRHTYLDFKTQVNPSLWFMVVAIMFFSAPVFEQAIKLNEQMRLPEALSGLENWMKAKESEQERLTNLLLSDTTYPGLLTSLIVVAVIAAIGEEFLFRGCVQGILTRWFKNPHTAIWLTAIIFSAIHLQFYGFLPRMLLGALFGYLLFWGKNIWLPVLAHFINNATATISAFYLKRQGKSLDELDFSQQIPNYLYFTSFVLAAVLLYQYYKIATKQNTRSYGKTLD